MQNQASSTSSKPPIKNDWDFMFQPMFNEYFKPPSGMSITISTTTLPLPDIVRASSSTSIDQDAPSQTSHINSTNVEKPNNKEDVVFDSDTFTNPFTPPKTSSAKSLSRIVDTSNIYTFQQPQINTRRWTKDRPLVTIIGNLFLQDVNLLLMPYGAIFTPF
ncbi:hypothetical protein Tco_1152386 [Tanacetum coccineum]